MSLYEMSERKEIKEGTRPRTDGDKIAMLVREYLSGGTDALLDESIQRWLSTPDGTLAKDKALREAFDAYVQKYDRPSPATLRGWEQICRRLQIEQPRKRSLLRRITIRHRIALAAVIAVAVVFGISRLGRDAATDGATSGPVQYARTIESLSDESVSLSCGSQVILSAGATLKIDESDPTRRAVFLEGEAFFSVTADGRPFEVNTSHITVNVLGTEFTVRSLASEDISEVGLFSGRVTVTDPGASTDMRPGERLSFNKQTGAVSIDSLTESLTGIKKAWFDFADTPLEEALREIAGYYGLEPDIALPGGERRLRVIFTGESAQEVTALLNLIYKDIHFTIDDKYLRVNPR